VSGAAFEELFEKESDEEDAPLKFKFAKKHEAGAVCFINGKSSDWIED
jgi:hypothetical protein